MRLGCSLLFLAALAACGGDDPAPMGSPPLQESGGTSSSGSGGSSLAQSTGGSAAIDDDAGVQGGLLPTPTTVSEAISQATGGKTPVECGCLGHDSACPADQVGTITTCFNDGFASCSPVKLDLVQFGADGARIVTSYVTQKTDGTCRVVVLADWTADTTTNCKLYRFLCPSVSFTGFGADTMVEGNMCTPAQVLAEGC